MNAVDAGLNGQSREELIEQRKQYSDALQRNIEELRNSRRTLTYAVNTLTREISEIGVRLDRTEEDLRWFLLTQSVLDGVTK